MYYDRYQGTSESYLAIHEESQTEDVRIRAYALKKGATVKVSDSQEFNPFSFPAMYNFNGKKLPFGWVSSRKERRTNLVLLDTGIFVSTNNLYLRLTKPDYRVLSFYRMFGYPRKFEDGALDFLGI